MRYVRYWIIWTLDFSQNLYYGDYLFVYAYDDNNVVALINPTPESADTPEAKMPYEEVVDTMGYDMLDEMEQKNGKICDDSDYICGEEHEIDDDT